MPCNHYVWDLQCLSSIFITPSTGCCCCCVAVLRPRWTSKIMSGRSVNLTTLFLGRLRPPKRLTSTSCAYFRQQLTTVPLESAEGETKVCCQTGYRTQDLWLMSQVPYRLRYAARPPGALTYGACALPTALRDSVPSTGATCQSHLQLNSLVWKS